MYILHDCCKAPHFEEDFPVEVMRVTKISSMIHLPVAPCVLVESQSIGLPNGRSRAAQKTKIEDEAGAT